MLKVQLKLISMLPSQARSMSSRILKWKRVQPHQRSILILMRISTDTWMSYFPMSTLEPQELRRMTSLLPLSVKRIVS